MSGRAVQKALRKRESELLQKSAANGGADADASQSEDDNSPPKPPKPSFFALLGQEVGEGEDDSDEQEAAEMAKQEDSTTAPIAKKKKKRKRGKKPAGPLSTAVLDKGKEEEGDGDEIDRALRELDLKQPVATSVDPENWGYHHDGNLASILRVDSRNLDAVNEMRKIFGKAAFAPDGYEDNDEGAVGGRRRGGRQRGLMQITAGVAAGRGLSGGRKNIFIQPKEIWPNVGSGGLGMEIVGRNNDGTVEFKFVHSRAYQDVQRHFLRDVDSMDPARLVVLMQNNPYHIATLLQVSEIAAEQREHTSSADILERALFSFGRALHSSFTTKLSEGKARLSFLRFENREFWYTCWRYISNLGMRGTWRTAVEVAKMLLAMDPNRDPYCLCLLIDFLALKARQPEYLLSLVESPFLQKKHSHLPNMAFSAALAYRQLGKDVLARECLAKAITKFPWMVESIYSELSLDADLTPALWGINPPDTIQELLCELYVFRSIDLWREPEASKLLIEVASTIFVLPKSSILPKKAHVSVDENGDEIEKFNDINIDLARHVLLTGRASIISMVPREFTSRPTRGHDPLPPRNDINSYVFQSFDDATVARPLRPGEQMDESAIVEFVRNSFRRILVAGEATPGVPPSRSPSLRQALVDMGVRPEDVGRTIEVTERMIREGDWGAFFPGGNAPLPVDFGRVGLDETGEESAGETEEGGREVE